VFQGWLAHCSSYSAAVTRWWQRFLWPTLAALGWGLATIFGVIAAIQHVGPRDHEPNWADKLTAVATAVLALAAVIALVQVYFALAQTREARLAKDAQARSEFWRRWAALRPVRRKVRIWEEAGGPEALRDKALGFRSANSPEYTELMTLLDFFEDLAISVRNEEIQFRTVDDFWGDFVTKYWVFWKPYVDEVRRENRNANRHFESLAEQIRERRSR
jgi:hypothetical protein